MTAMAQRLEVGQFVEFVERPVRQVQQAACHYMLRLHPNYEMKAERQLAERGIEVYVPKEQRSVKGVWNRRALRVVPIFSGIMFVPDFNADLARLKAVADGIGGFVKRTKEDGEIEAVPVGPYWMRKIRKFEKSCNSPEAVQARARVFHVHQKVRIVGGPWDMWEGRIARLDSHHRLSVLIEAMEREVPVELDEDQVEAV
jgi:transcription antitermination factor NusG